jgi:hypothetical protein
MSHTSSLDQQRHTRGQRRARAAAPRVAAVLTIAVLGVPALTGADALAKYQAPRQRCHDFIRFGERWELCRTADGALQRHRIGVLP